VQIARDAESDQFCAASRDRRIAPARLHDDLIAAI
jgi:hypothetical protein